MAINKTTQGRMCRYVCVCVLHCGRSNNYSNKIFMLYICFIYGVRSRVCCLALLRVSNRSDRIGCAFSFPVSYALICFYDNLLRPSKTNLPPLNSYVNLDKTKRSINCFIKCRSEFPDTGVH